MNCIYSQPAWKIFIIVVIGLAVMAKDELLEAVCRKSV